MVSAAIDHWKRGPFRKSRRKTQIYDRGLQRVLTLKRVTIVRDDIDVIAADVEMMAGAHDVFTSVDRRNAR